MKGIKVKVFLVFILFLVSVYISLPKNFSLFGHQITRQDIDISIFSWHIKKEFKLLLGLDLAGGTHLVFEAKTENIGVEDRKEALESLREVIEKRVNFFGISEPNIQLSKFGDRDRIIVELPGIREPQEAIKLIGRTAQLVFAEVEEVKNGNLNFKETELKGNSLKKARVVFDRFTGKPAVSIEFNKEGSQKFAELTKRNLGKPLAIILDGELISAPIVKEEILNGQAQISGDFSTEEAKNLAIQINAGALPLEVSLVEQKTVGATLGQESIKRSIYAGLIGLLMVLLFMVFIYKELGIIADIALIMFAFLTLAVYKIISVVLTLPGIAGFLLSVGMAVDSNILIFERFKEEIRKKRNVEDALEVSFGRAWDSIRDANISTLITAFILANPLDFSFLHTSGPVRGFAITLSLGILISLFTGIVVSRNLLRFFLFLTKRQ